MNMAAQQAEGRSPDQLHRMALALDGHVLEYTLRRSQRRSIGFLIGADGLRVTAPRWVSQAEIEKALREKQGWILTKLRERQSRQTARREAVEWRDGGHLPYLGGHITLRLAQGSANRVRFDPAARELNVSLSAGAGEQQLKDRVQAWFKAEAKRLFAQRLPHFAQGLGVQCQTFSLTSASTRWGSCSSRGTIRLNWRLMHFDQDLIDYVIAHELSHLLEMNHSPRFWATVGRVYPNHTVARKTLRQRAQELPTVF